jgi:hypothetical protein
MFDNGTTIAWYFSDCCTRGRYSIQANPASTNKAILTATTSFTDILLVYAAVSGLLARLPLVHHYGIE